MARTVRLNWPLTLEERQRVPNSSGGYTETWTLVGEMWGDVQTRGVSAGDVAAGELSRVRYRIIVRGAAMGDPARPKVGQRFRSGNRAFEIDAVTEMDASGIFLIAWAREEILQ